MILSSQDKYDPGDSMSFESSRLDNSSSKILKSNELCDLKEQASFHALSSITEESEPSRSLESGSSC